ncbi:hypothetical protein B0T17DRAFT_504028 [Bombardia bombarda]|uniref:LOV domain-containing protein n=1 Tax=Bombardia bombarda TaxID=252184 RepID=A0AA40CFH9_9PEZI|nr:hypothetical protein B0T17DRAFT_504028 [Bombardia bombarda]
MHLRLRSDSGLALHTNQAGFRQYTDYTSDGSLRSPTTGYRKRPLSYDGVSSFEALSLGKRQSAESRPSLQVPQMPQQFSLADFFDPAVVKMAFSDPITGERMCQFAEGTSATADMEFLLKVDEYTRCFGNLTSIISHISTNFTGAEASSPLHLPQSLSNAVKNNTKRCANSYLPPLEKLYKDSKVVVEERLAKELYPEFLKFQLSQCMRSSLAASRSFTGGGLKPTYPGLGNSFCLTDPLQADYPFVYASEGMANMTGYGAREILTNNGRLLQGPCTDAVAARRIREAMIMGRETTELIVNYRKDGSPFWNLVFICPLKENGNVRFCLGGQINVSDGVGQDVKDMMRILNFSPPGEQIHRSTSRSNSITSVLSNKKERPVWRHPATTPSGAAVANRSAYRFFRRISRRSDAPKTAASKRGTSRPVTPSTSSTPAAAAADDPLPPSAKRRAIVPTQKPQQQQQQPEPKVNRPTTPYPCFFVMKYIIEPASQPAATTAATAGASQAAVDSSHHNKRHNSNATTTTTNITPRMPISFFSASALELLGLKTHDGEQILNKDIFTVLTEISHSPSVSRCLRGSSNIMDSITAGKSASADLLVSTAPTAPTSTTAAAAAAAAPSAAERGLPSPISAANGSAGRQHQPAKHSRNGSTILKSSMSGSNGNGHGHNHSVDFILPPAATSTSNQQLHHNQHHHHHHHHHHHYGPRFSDTLDRGAEILSHMFWHGHHHHGGGGGSNSKMRKLVSHWTPLLDNEGRIGWVLLILTPVSAVAAVGA